MASQVAYSLLTLALAATSVNAHAFFHTGYVNDVSQGHLFGVRAPASNSPIQDVTSSAITCNSPLYSPVSTDVIEVAPGDQFGMQWNHNIAGPTAGDADDPIASSHKGPVMVYMAKVDDASTADGSDLKWFKVAEEGLNNSTGTWGVDTLIANAGLWSFTMPNLAAGEYLLRGEVLALHSAGSEGGAQFYMSCAGIKVTGSGTCSPSDTVSFPGAYSATDAGILINIYGSTGQPDNGGKAYTAPGPSVATCDGSASTASSSAASSAASSSASVSVSATATTANNVASSTTTTSESVEATSLTSAVESSSSVLATSATSSSFTTTPQAALPTTLSTVTGRPANNATRPYESRTRSQPANTRTSKFTLSASGLPTNGTTTSTRRHNYGNGNGNGHGNSNGNVPTTSSTSLALTASPSETGVKIPTSTATATASDSATAIAVDATSTSIDDSATASATASASSTGYPMTGPSGKKFMCYEVTDF